MTGCTEPTFTSYNAADASSYAQGRASSYPSALYHQIFAFAGMPLPSKNKSFTTLLDVGCGTGQATRDLAPQFARVVATDPSPAMIEEARKRDYRTGTGEAVEFSVKCAEECDEIDGLDLGSVDVLVAAMAVSSAFAPDRAITLHQDSFADYRSAGSLVRHGQVLEERRRSPQAGRGGRCVDVRFTLCS